MSNQPRSRRRVGSGPDETRRIVQADARRHATELGMLIFAVALTVLGYADAALAHDDHLPAGIGVYTAIFAGLVIGLHLLVRRCAPDADPLLLPIAVALNGLGLVLIYRLDFLAIDKAMAAGKPAPSGVEPNQLIWTVIGMALFAMILIGVRDHRRLQRYTYTAMAAGLVLLVLPAMLPASMSEVNGARQWIRLAGFSIQPAEFAKLLLVIFFAGYLVVNREALTLASKKVAGLNLPRGRDIGPLVAVWLICMAVVAIENEFGPALLFFGAFIVLLYVATERASWVLFGLVMASVGAYGAYLVIPHIRPRIEAWQDPLGHAQASGFQLSQALFGFAAGGVTGTGLDRGHPELLGFAINTDFILVTVGEELGLAGMMALYLLYGLLVARGLRAALGVRDGFGKLLAAGLAIGLALQVFIVAGGVTDLIPLTGMTLPFVAYGGSSLVANWALVALLVRISDAARRPVPPPAMPDQELTQVITG